MVFSFCKKAIEDMQADSVSTDLYGVLRFEPGLPSRYLYSVWKGGTALTWTNDGDRLVMQCVDSNGLMLRLCVVEVSRRIFFVFGSMPYRFFVRIALMNEQQWISGKRKEILLPGQFQLKVVSRKGQELIAAGGKLAYIEAFISPGLTEDLALLFPRLREFLDRSTEESKPSSVTNWAPAEVLDAVYDGLQEPSASHIERHLTGDKLRDIMMLILKKAFDKDEQMVAAGQVQRAAANEVRWMIETELKHHQSNTKLAAATAVSAFVLKRIFRKLFGVGMFGFLRKRRMRKAMLLLQQTDMTIKSVADEVGLPDVSTFTQTFKKFFGITPGAVRSKMLNGNTPT